MAGSSACLPPSYRAYSLSMWTDKAEVEREMDWKKLLPYITGSMDQEVLLPHEYLVTENDLSARPTLTSGVHIRYNPTLENLRDTSGRPESAPW